MLRANVPWPKSKLGWWLAIIFVVIVVGVATGGILLFRSQAAAVQATEARALESIAALKVAQIADWRNERAFDAGILASSPLVRERVAEWLRTRTPAVEASLQANLRSYVNLGRYANVVLVDADGAPLLEANPAQIVRLCAETSALVAEALVKRAVVFGDIARCGPAGELRLQLVAPLLGAGDSATAPPAFAVFSIDPADFLFPFIQTWPVPSNTAETLLVRREGENVIYLNELRHRAGSALNLQFPVGDNLLPASVAATGQERTLIGHDYRGEDVLAVTRIVPGSNWYLVAKADTAELFADLTGTAYRFALAVLGLIALAAVTVGLVFNRQQSDSLRQLYDEQRARQRVLERFAALVQSASDAILMTDAQGRIEEANPQAAALFGVGAPELLGQPLISLASPEEQDALRAGFAAADNGDAVRFEYRQVARDGRSTPVEASVNVVYLDDARHVQAILRDISERRRAEAALRASEEKFRVLFSELNVGIVVHAANTCILYTNPTSQRLLGMTPEQLLGRAAADPAWYFVQSDGERLEVEGYPVNRVLATGAPLHDYLIGIVATAGARPVWVLVDAFPLWDSDQVREVVVTFVDVTEREQAQAERARLLLELQLKNRDLESVVYVASHDLRSPLVNIQGFGQRLQTDIHKLDQIVGDSADVDTLRAAAAPLLAERIPNALRYISASGAKMDALISGLLRLSRAGRAEIHPVAVDMNGMLAAIVNAMAYQLENAGALVQMDDLPPCWGDADQINQVFSNLLDNAIKYRDLNRPLHIHVSGQRRRDVVTYMVADTGRGIPLEHQDRIWEIFHRLEPAGATPGEGLGLTLTRRIVERQNGKIWVESQPGIGSKFCVALPATTTER